MDPRTTLEMMVQNILDNEGDDAQDRFDDLAEWIRKGGFVPSLKEAMFKVNHGSEHHP